MQGNSSQESGLRSAQTQVVKHTEVNAHVIKLTDTEA